MSQTTIFDSIIETTADELLDLLNMDRKPKEIYHPQYFAKVGNYTVVIVAKSKTDVLGNIIDQDGKIPDGFCVNWRILSIIKQDLKELKNDKNNR